MAFGLDKLVDLLKAAGEPTRFRLLALLAAGDLTVTDLTEILGQSQPRISRHLKLLTEEGLIERYQEGAWAYFRLRQDGEPAVVIRQLLGAASPSDAVLQRDSERLATVKRVRAERAQDYFSRNASAWDELRRLHVSDEAVEGALLKLVGTTPIDSLLDLGTGTGRMLELFGPHIERGLGIDMSLDMLSLARARLERAGLKHCSVRQGDIYELPVPKDSFDVVLIHQVLHFLDDGGRAIAEAARTLRPQGRLLVVDFAPHDLEFLREEHAHLRLGFAPESVTQWMNAAGLDVALHRVLPPEPESEGKIAVSLWLARDPRLAVVASAQGVA